MATILRRHGSASLMTLFVLNAPHLPAVPRGADVLLFVFNGPTLERDTSPRLRLASAAAIGSPFR
jgi:hypothetical protein